MKDAILTFSLLVAVFLALLIQEFIPALEFMHGARVNFVPVLFCYGALIVPFPLMLVLAGVTGFFLDLTYLAVLGGVVEIPLGWSILLYVAMGLICQGLRPLALRGHWELHALMSAVTAVTYLALQFGMISLRRFDDGGLMFNNVALWRILGPGIIALLVSPPFYFLVEWVTRRFAPQRRMVRGF